MSSLLCCTAPRRRCRSPSCYSPECELHPPAKPSSIVSVSLPPDIVPHRPSTGIDQIKSLREIFGASPSSHKGYKAAAKASGSFDASLKFGGGDSPRAGIKARQSIDRFTQNLRDRVSHSRLSNRSSKRPLDGNGSKTKNSSTLLAKSLDDLLLSRTVSEGGYDSDAKGIRTPAWRRPSGTSMLNTDCRSETLVSGKKSLDRPPTLNLDLSFSKDIDFSPKIMKRRSSSMRSYSSPALLDWGIKLDDLQRREVSTPVPQRTPPHDCHSSLLHRGSDESPSDVLRRLSIGLANGTVRLPHTPELKAMQLAGSSEGRTGWKHELSAPRRSSSLHRGDPEVKYALKSLGDRLDKAKRGSVAGSWKDNKHASLISNIDPELLKYLNRYGEEDRDYEFDGPSYQAGDENIGRPQTGDAGHEAGMGDTNLRSGGTSETAVNNDHITNNGSSEGATLEKQMRKDESVHLFDMRISQRLAPTSAVPTMSPSSTQLSSLNHDADHDSLPQSLIDRFPLFQGRTSTEPVRRPSDPNTRRIFEGSSEHARRISHTRWRSKSSFGSLNPAHSFPLEAIHPGNASSVYLSDVSEDPSFSHLPPSRRLSTCPGNPNSVAMPGRAASTGRNPSASDGGGFLARETRKHARQRSLADVMSATGTATDSEADRNERMSEVDVTGLLGGREMQ